MIYSSPVISMLGMFVAALNILILGQFAYALGVWGWRFEHCEGIGYTVKRLLRQEWGETTFCAMCLTALGAVGFLTVILPWHFSYTGVNESRDLAVAVVYIVIGLAGNFWHLRIIQGFRKRDAAGGWGEVNDCRLPA